MKRTITHVLLSLALVFCAFTAAADTNRWVHVEVQGDEQVRINLPLSLVAAAVAMIPKEARADANKEMQIAFDGMDIEWAQLMELWQSVKDAPEATFVTVRNEDQTIEVKKEGDFLLVNTTGDSSNGPEVDVRFPLAVVDALLSGPEGTLDLEAALDALADEADGHIVSIRDNSGNGETVRIWIDDQNVSDD